VIILEKIALESYNEQMPHFFVKENEEQVFPHNRVRVGHIISGVAVENEDAYLLEAIYIKSKNRLKFTQYRLPFERKTVNADDVWLYDNWIRISPNSDGTIIYGKLHYIENVESTDVDNVVRLYFTDFSEHVKNRS